MIAYLQASQGEPVNVNVFVARDGFRTLGAQICLFEEAELAFLDLSPDNPVFGYVSTVRRALRLMNLPGPENLDLPEVLLPWVRRSTWTMTLGDVRRNLPRSIFIKPLHAHKSFPGHVVASFGDLIRTAHLDDDFPVLASEPVEFVSEYRAFVLHGEVVGLKHYRGDFRLFPDTAFIDSAVAEFTSAPSAYSLDVGVRRDGITDLVEINDALALGAYGLSALPYARMINARWREVTGG